MILERYPEERKAEYLEALFDIMIKNCCLSQITCHYAREISAIEATRMVAWMGNLTNFHKPIRLLKNFYEFIRTLTTNPMKFVRPMFRYALFSAIYAQPSAT